MKCLNKSGTKVMDKLVSGLEVPGDAKTFDMHGYTEKWNGGIMAVHVENIGNVPSTGSGNLYSVAHYYKQNGDMMRDPEMIFWAAKTRDKDLMIVNAYYPIYFRMDPIIEQSSAVFRDGELHGFKPKMQSANYLH
jgi:hypothetical protein